MVILFRFSVEYHNPVESGVSGEGTIIKEPRTLNYSLKLPLIDPFLVSDPFPP